jgi:hypothetical protein
VVLGLVVRIWLIARYPVIFGGDTVLRLVNYEYIVLSYQLPLLQAPIHYLHALNPDPTAVRWLMSLIGTAAGVGFYLLTAELVSRTTAFYAAVLFTLHPFILPLSTVPYQEILMVAGLLFGFYGAVTGRWLVASAGLGAACLTRYESWLACPLLAALYLKERGVSLRRLAEATLLFGWAPLAWIAYNRGLTPAGSFAVEGHVSVARLVRWAFLGYQAVRNTPIPVLLLSGIGAAVFVRRRLWTDRRYQLLAAYLVVFMVAILFYAHGLDPDVERRVTVREIHIPLLGILVLAALGLTTFLRYRAVVVALSAVMGLLMTTRFLQRETTVPALALAVEAAHYLDGAVQRDEQVAVLARPAGGVERYLQGAEAKGGAEGRRAAIAILNQLENTPPDYQRILVHSHLGKERLRSYASLKTGTGEQQETLVPGRTMERQPDWVVLWADFQSSNDTESQLWKVVQPLKPLWSEVNGELSVAIYHVGNNGDQGPAK